MEFTSFTGLIKKEIEKRLGIGYRVRLNNVRKNNNIVLTGLTIMQEDKNLSPTIYLNNYYEKYVNCDVTISNIVSDVMKTYRKNKVSQSVDMRYFLNYETVKSHIVYKIVNTEKNKELLEDIPHKEFMDLSIVFQCIVSQEELGTASILIHNVHLRLWDVTVQELYQTAEENTPKLFPHEIKPMAEVLCNIMQSENPDQYNHEQCMADFADSVPMYVLSNNRKVEGAACMLYPNVISDFADKVGSDLYIIPSSIHELLLLPTENDEGSAEIKSMIREINDTQVSEEEILSYSLYYYNRETGEIVSL